MYKILSTAHVKRFASTIVRIWMFSLSVSSSGEGPYMILDKRFFICWPKVAAGKGMGDDLLFVSGIDI